MAIKDGCVSRGGGGGGGYVGRQAESQTPKTLLPEVFLVVHSEQM